jgi:lincosamide nucleotidyltransferase
LGRGEHARAEAFLTLVHDHLLKALRLVEGTSANWLSPTRRLEEDVSATSYERYRACTAALGAEQLAGAYASTWEWSRELMDILAVRHALTLPEALLYELDRRVSPRGQPPKPNFPESRLGEVHRIRPPRTQANREQ